MTLFDYNSLEVNDLVVIFDRSIGHDPNSELMRRALGVVKQKIGNAGVVVVRITRQLANTGYEVGSEHIFTGGFHISKVDSLTALALESE